jgi:four helix bundle protein
MQDFHKLRAWCLADELANKVVDTFPLDGSRAVTGLRGQAIRAAKSIPANLAEGCGKSTPGEFLSSIDVALGSAAELENHLGSARTAGIVSQYVHAHLLAKLITLGKMVRALRVTIEHAAALEEKSKREKRPPNPRH